VISTKFTFLAPAPEPSDPARKYETRRQKPPMADHFFQEATSARLWRGRPSKSASFANTLGFKPGDVITATLPANCRQTGSEIAVSKWSGCSRYVLG
jgi:hypothetical protein